MTSVAKRRMWAKLVTVLLACLGACQATVTLRHLSTVYMPSAIDDSTETFGYNTDAVEQIAYDVANSYIYVVGVNIVHVVNFSDPSQMQSVDYHQFTTPGETTDVEACGDFVAVAYDNSKSPLEGLVHIFRRYDGSDLVLLQTITVGALPDMVKFTHNCDRVVVAIEGELRMVNGQVTDPEGKVVIITLLDTDAAYTLETLDFTSFNEDADEYIAKGVRWVWRGENSDINTTFSQDLEPEYIAISEDDTKAYICLQENNAVATVDLTVPEIIDIYPLGQRSWKEYLLDPSDEDNGIHLGNWDVHGMHQPDGIRLVTIAGTEYLLTANEGDTKVYEEEEYGFSWSELLMGSEFEAAGLIDESVSEELVAHLNDDAKLGRLKMSTVDGIVADTGKINKFYTYGGRGFCLYDVSDFSLVYSSQDLMEVEIADQYPAIFNSDHEEAGLTPEGAKDRESDDKGPGPESLDYAELEFANGVVKKLIFVGIERPGFIGIFRVTDDFPSEGGIVLESLHYNGGTGETFEDLWSNRIARDLDNEDVKILPADRSPTEKPLLAVGGAVSGTLSLYEIYDDGKEPGGCSGLSPGAFVGLVVVYWCMQWIGIN